MSPRPLATGPGLYTAQLQPNPAWVGQGGNFSSDRQHPILLRGINDWPRLETSILGVHFLIFCHGKAH